MRWPWTRTEKRDSWWRLLSDAVVRLIEAQAAGTAADASSTAAVEAASRRPESRAFAAATVESRTLGTGSRHPGCAGSDRP